MRPLRASPWESGDAPRYSFARPTPVVKWLLWSNIGLGLVFLLFASRFEFLRAIYEALWLDPDAWRVNAPWVPAWQLVSFGWLHDAGGPMHLLYNMLGLYFFGTALEGELGSRRFAFFYALGIVLPGALQLAVSLAIGGAPVVGASGAVLMLVVALAVLRPHMPVVFILVPMPLWVMASIFVGLDLVGLAGKGGGNTAYLVHLGGAALGFVAAKFGWLWSDPLAAWRSYRAAQHVRREIDDEERFDKLLERIHREGIGSLSDSDREFMRRVSQRKSG